MFRVKLGWELLLERVEGRDYFHVRKLKEQVVFEYENDQVKSLKRLGHFKGVGEAHLELSIIGFDRKTFGADVRILSCPCKLEFNGIHNSLTAI